MALSTLAARIAAYIAGQVDEGPTARSATVTGAAGPVYLVKRQLGSTSTLALIAGTSSNLTIANATGIISASAAIGAGVSQVAVVRESALDNRAQEFPITLTGATPTPTPAPTPTPTPSPTPTPTPTPTPAPAAAFGTSSPILFMATDEAPGAEQFLVYGLSQAPVIATSDGPVAGRFVAGAQLADGSWPVLKGSGAVASSDFSVIVGDGQGNTRPVIVRARPGRAIQRQLRNVLQVAKPQHAIDIQVAELNNPNNHPSLGAPTHYAIKSGFWRDPSVWAASVVPNGYQPVSKQLLDPLTGQFETKSCGTAVVNIGGYTVTIDEDADFKHIHVGGAGKLYVRNKPGLRTVVTLDTHMGHGWADVRTVGTASNTVDFVFVQHEAPGVTAKLGFNNHGRLRMVGGVRADELFAPAQLNAGDTWIPLPGLAAGTTNWNVGDEVVIPFHGDHEETSDPAVGWTSQVPVDFSTCFVTQNLYNPSLRKLWPFISTRAFAIDRSQRRRILEIDLAGERIRVAPLDRTVIVWSKDRVKPNADGTPGQVMRTRTLKPRVINECRTIRLRSADPRTLQTRGHLMAMGGDSQLYGVHAMWMGRTSFDSSFCSPSGDQAWSGDITLGDVDAVTHEQYYAKGPTATLRTDPDNVPGRYPFHIGHEDGATFADGGNCLLNCSESSPDYAILTAGMVSHGDRSFIFGGSITGAKAKGWMGENGNEIGIGHNVKIVGVTGNGAESGTASENTRANGSWFKMVNSYGVAWDSQSRHFGAFANVAFDCMSHQSYLMQSFYIMSPLLRDYWRGGPALNALTVSDPLSAGNNYAVLIPSGDSAKDTLVNGFWAAEANIYLNWDNISVGCRDGRIIYDRDASERTTDLPVEFLRNDCFGCVRPVNYPPNYVQRYNERDAIHARLTPAGAFGAVQIGGAATYGMNVVDVTTYNFPVVVADVGVGPNDQGHFLRLCNATAPGQVFSQATRGRPSGGIYSNAFYDDPHNSPDWGVYGGMYDPNTRQLYTGTTWPSGGLLPRLWVNHLDGDDLTQDGPIDEYNRTVPAWAVGKGPGIHFDPATDYEYDYATQKDMTGIAIHSAVGKIRGVYIDGFGVRAMGRNVNVQVTPYSQGTGQGQPGRDFGSQTLDYFIRANGLWNDNGQWKIILWTPTYDGPTGAPIQTRNDRRVKNLTPEIIAACERDPLLTRQVMPPRIEVPKITPMHRRTVAPVLRTLPASVTPAATEKLWVPLKSDLPTAKYVLSGPDAAQFEAVYVAAKGGIGLRYLGDASAVLSNRTVTVAAQDPETGLTSAVQTINVVVSPAVLVDAFGYTGQLEFARWTFSNIPGPLVANGDGTATLTAAGGVSGHDAGSATNKLSFTIEEVQGGVIALRMNHEPNTGSDFVDIRLGTGGIRYDRPGQAQYTDYGGGSIVTPGSRVTIEMKADRVQITARLPNGGTSTRPSYPPNATMPAMPATASAFFFGPTSVFGGEGVGSRISNVRHEPT